MAVRKALNEDSAKNTMLSNEKDKLLEFLHSGTRWCQDAEARASSGNPVKFHDPLATAWDITGALCGLFGWKRAGTLLGQFERHIHKRRRLPRLNPHATIESMETVQAYNDGLETTFQGILTLFMTMPVWSRVSRTIGQSVTPGSVGQKNSGGFPRA